MLRASIIPALGAALLLTPHLSAEEKLSFNKDIRPILSDKCFACHGFDAKHREADLRLDTAEGAYANNNGAFAIRPGSLEKSEAWRLITSTDKDEQMPPPKSHKTLSPAEKETIRKWILQGAPYQRHWAFEPQVKATPPPVPAGMQARNTVDAFIFDRLRKEGLKPQPEADKETLIRRVTFALTGMPPTIAEVNAFLADQSPNAYETVVDRLLASPRYGEQMARPWLDLARYGDTHGLHLDNERQMWLYRDWVVEAFNRNLPYNDFTIEQLAGDLLPNPTQQQLVATGFNRCNVTTAEGGAIAAEFLFRYAIDRTSTTAETWMGLSAGCAVCHDHKFDPITQKEFYQLYAFFNSAADPAMDGNGILTAPTIRVEMPEQKKKLTELQERIAATEKQLEATVARLAYADPANARPLPPAVEKETVLADEGFPTGAKVTSNPAGRAVDWVEPQDNPPPSGKRALRISGKAMAQDYYEGGAPVIDVPPGARFAVNVLVDPAEPAKAVMIQFHTGAWSHRAMWGDAKAIPGFGKPNTPERFVAGPLPAASRWTKLEFRAEDVGLKAGDRITGIAFTLDGGTALFDGLTMTSRAGDAHDPEKSLTAWLAAREGKESPGFSAEINKLLKGTPAAKRNAAQQKQLRDYYLANACVLTKAAIAPLTTEIAKFKKEREEMEKTLPSTFVMKDLDKNRDSFVMDRGAYDKPKDKVTRDVPAAFPPLPNKQNPNRLDLAKWLVADNHPLTARVTVNRFWQQFFGVGLVKTSGDFGSQGQPPSHPELLDHLAVSFRESKWDVKRLVRFLVTSAAFRQASTAPAESWARDPENRLLARGPRFRLDAEELRDNALAVSGLLDSTIGGKGTRPYQPPNIWEPVGFGGSNTRFYKRDAGSALYRRSLYVFLKRTAPPPFMANFDAPSREQSCTVRERSNTPLQALQLMNDEQHIEAARAFAEQIMTQGGATPEERITFAYRSVVSRKPSPEEMIIVREALNQHLLAFNQVPANAAKFIRQGESKPRPGLPEPELAAWTLIANLVLNLDETVSRN